MLTTQTHVFTDPRQDGDIDLIAETRVLLVNSGLSNEVNLHYDTNRYIKDASLMRPEGQRFLLNRFWNLQLLSTQASTVDERYCLVNNGEYSDWLRLYKQKILPFAIAHRLPKTI